MAVEPDLPQLAQLRWDFRAEDGTELPVVSREEFLDVCLAFLRQGLAGGYHTYWLAEVAGLIIAHVFVHRIDLVPRPCQLRDRFGYVTNNYTRPAYRNQGIGAELMRHVAEWARAEDFELLIVYPSEEAVTFYQRAGFRAENDVMELPLRPFVVVDGGPQP